jgi:pimeloyl-ACP methyl ester carboxylesterase
LFHIPTLASPALLARSVVLAAAVSLTACGGGDSKNDEGGAGGTTPPPVATAGELKSAALLNTITPAQIIEALGKDASKVQGIVPRYSVTSYRLEYMTIDAQGKEVRASGLVSVPVKAAGARSPVLGYQHGTIFKSAEAPSNNAVGSEVAVVMASLGYIVVAPDYVGYGVSKGTPHPYLLSAPTAAATLDMLTAARTWRGQGNAVDNGQLFLTGYSEGGYATMAAHRALQAGNAPERQALRMVVVGAGPYNVQATLDGLVNVVRDREPVLGALINPGFLRYLGGSVQREVRRALLKALLPDDADVTFDNQFIDNFLADDTQAVARVSNVHDWKPQVPVRLYHGRDDVTVPYGSSVTTLQAMRAQGAGDLVTLTDCPAVPSSHIGCVPPFMNYMLGQLAPLAQDL